MAIEAHQEQRNHTAAWETHTDDGIFSTLRGVEGIFILLIPFVEKL